MKKVFICIFTFTLIMLNSIFDFTCASSSDVRFYMSCSNESVYRNNEVSVLISVEALKSVNVSTFKLTINFDEQELSFKDVSSCNALNDSELKYNVNGSKLDIIFLTDFEGLNIDANQKVNLMEVDFKVKTNVHSNGTVLSAKLDGVGNYSENYLSVLQPDDINIEILDEPKFDCRLMSLKPLEASLNPDFDPDIYEYTVDVPYDFKEIEFDYTTVEKNAEVKINRRTLKKAGEETKIKITVLSPDKKGRLTYTVNVKRDVKEDIKKDTKENIKKNNRSSPNKSKCDKMQKKSTDGSKKEIKDVNKNEINDDDKDLRTLVVRKNGFSFIIFAIVSVVFIIILFSIWFTRRNNYKSDEQ